MESNSKCEKFGGTNKKKLIFITITGVVVLLMPIALAYINPVILYAKYKFRVENDTVLHELLRRPFQSVKVYIYLFNVTNPEEFLSGIDNKVKLQEFGPFVYQEIRTNEDIVINAEPGVMWFTAKTRPVFIPEESIGDPKDVYYTSANVPLLYATALLSKYPDMMKQIFNFIVSYTHSKPFIKITAHDLFWGYDDPLFALAHKMLPGVVYFKSMSMMDRLYDKEFNYRLKVGTTDSDKFSVKQSIRIKPKDKPGFETYEEKILILPNDTYEGEIFPMDLSADKPLNIYRTSICRTFQFKYNTSRPMFYGGNGYVYKQREPLNDRQHCFSNGWCPRGLLSMAPCYWDLPLIVTKGHFLDADPGLLELVEGLKPDRNIHDGEIVIDPKLGVFVEGYLSAQVSIFLAHNAYNPQTRRLQNTVLPYMHVILKSPPPIEEALHTFHIFYKSGPLILLASQMCCALLGLGLLAYLFRLLYLSWLARNNDLKKKVSSKVHQPLIMDYKIANKGAEAAH